MQASRPPSPLINVRGYGGQPSPESERRLVRKRGFEPRGDCSHWLLRFGGRVRTQFSRVLMTGGMQDWAVWEMVGSLL